MSKENEKTIEVYERFGQNYLKRNSDDVKNNPKAKKDDDRQKELLKKFTDGLPKDAKIFEVGSAGGKDADFIRSLGYTNVTVSDVADFFLRELEKKGLSPIKFNLITDEFGDKYDFILCWAVLVHFTKAEAKEAIRKMFKALNDGGRIALAVKHKEGHEEEWEDYQGRIGAKRFFSYWQKDELEQCLEECGFKNVQIAKHGGARACWLNCCAEK